MSATERSATVAERLCCFVCVCSKLWHQATLALEELVQDACFIADGNKDLLTLYNELVKDQPSGSSWSGFGSRMNAVKHAGVSVCQCTHAMNMPSCPVIRVCVRGRTRDISRILVDMLLTYAHLCCSARHQGFEAAR